MNLDYSQYNGNRLQGIFQSRRKLISHLLLHGRGTRRELSEALQVTFPAVSTHVNELLGSGIIESSGSIQQGKNRRTQEFVLSIPDKLCGAVSLTSRGAELFLLKFDGSLIERCFFAAKAHSQASVLEALRSVLELTEQFELSSVMVVIDGLVSTEHDVVFKVHGVERWEACSLVSLCRRSGSRCEIQCTPRGRALVRGWGQKLKVLHEIGVFELRDRRLILSSYSHGQCQLGHIGTESGLLHVHATGGKPCFCGKEDCFLAGIHAGIHRADYVKGGISEISDALNLRHVAVSVGECESPDDGQWGGTLLRNPEVLYEKGVAYVAAEQAWLHRLRQLFVPEFAVENVMKEYAALF